jgi:twitching motility two-component system response regulator PilH
VAKIIAVDDSVADLRLIESMLSSKHRVLLCLNGEGLEEKTVAEKPDLILMDVVMPQRNGYEIMRKLKRDPNTKDVPVIVVSSKSEVTDVEWGRRQGASEYLPKPFSAEDLLSKINSVLGSR